MPWLKTERFVFLCPTVGITYGTKGTFSHSVTKRLRSPIAAVGFCSFSQSSWMAAWQVHSKMLHSNYCIYTNCSLKKPVRAQFSVLLVHGKRKWKGGKNKNGNFISHVAGKMLIGRMRFWKCFGSCQIREREKAEKHRPPLSVLDRIYFREPCSIQW